MRKGPLPYVGTTALILHYFTKFVAFEAHYIKVVEDIPTFSGMSATKM